MECPAERGDRNLSVTVFDEPILNLVKVKGRVSIKNGCNVIDILSTEYPHPSPWSRQWIVDDPKLVVDADHFADGAFTAASQLCHLGVRFPQVILPAYDAVPHLLAEMRRHLGNGFRRVAGMAVGGKEGAAHA